MFTRRDRAAVKRAPSPRYSGDPAILGYDILNEPIAPYHDTATLNMRLEPFYRQVTQAIREVDPGRIVILAGGQWSSSFDMLGPPFADNLAYTYHLFWASTQRDSIQRHLNFANRYDVPLFLGETGELTDDWNERFRKLQEAHGIGWAFWTYKNLDTPSTVVSIPPPDAGPRSAVLTPQDAAARSMTRHHAFDGIRSRTVRQGHGIIDQERAERPERGKCLLERRRESPSSNSIGSPVPPLKMATSSCNRRDVRRARHPGLVTTAVGPALQRASGAFTKRRRRRNGGPC
jgi:hypothetical protein